MSALSAGSLHFTEGLDLVGIYQKRCATGSAGSHTGHSDRPNRLQFGVDQSAHGKGGSAPLKRECRGEQPFCRQSDQVSGGRHRHAGHHPGGQVYEVIMFAYILCCLVDCVLAIRLAYMVDIS